MIINELGAENFPGHDSDAWGFSLMYTCSEMVVVQYEFLLATSMHSGDQGDRAHGNKALSRLRQNPITGFFLARRGFDGPMTRNRPDRHEPLPGTPSRVPQSCEWACNDSSRNRWGGLPRRRAARLAPRVVAVLPPALHNAQRRSARQEGGAVTARGGDDNGGDDHGSKRE